MMIFSFKSQTLKLRVSRLAGKPSWSCYALVTGELDVKDLEFRIFAESELKLKAYTILKGKKTPFSKSTVKLTGILLITAVRTVNKEVVSLLQIDALATVTLELRRVAFEFLASQLIGIVQTVYQCVTNTRPFNALSGCTAKLVRTTRLKVAVAFVFTWTRFWGGFY